MGDRLEKLRRMQTAAVQDEEPIAEALRRAGFQAQRNTSGGANNRAKGDVLFRRTGSDQWRGIESQVVGDVPGYERFSYGVDKFERYTGDYVLLGCHEERGSPEMLFAIVGRGALHAELAKVGTSDGLVGFFLNEGYFVINPEALVASVPGVVLGASIEEAVRKKFAA